MRTAYFLYNLLELYVLLKIVKKGYCIFCYHRVKKSWNKVLIEDELHRTISQFQKQIELIKNVGQPIPLMEMVRRIKEGIVADKLYIAVTFDDGYRDNIDLAYPILKQFNIPATIFVTTAYVDNHNLLPYWDEMTYLVGQGKGYFHCSNNGKKGITVNLDTLTGKKVLLKYLNQYTLKNWPVGLEKCMRCLRSLVPEARTIIKNEFADWVQLKEYQQKGLITIGSHTVTHPILSRCEDAGKNEIEASKARIEEKLGTPISLFAYPFGRLEHFNQDTVRSLQNCGYIGAVTTINGINQAGDNPFILKRIPTNEIGIAKRLLTYLKMRR